MSRYSTSKPCIAQRRCTCNFDFDQATGFDYKNCIFHRIHRGKWDKLPELVTASLPFHLEK